MEGIQAALRILSLDRTDGVEGVDAALDVLRARPMTRSDSLKKSPQSSCDVGAGEGFPKGQEETREVQQNDRAKAR